jgi:hypothetical protein
VRSEFVLATLMAVLVALALSLGLCVQDDTYISLRYAHNLVDGHGLVFNPGETPVEGYTNFLWTLMLAGVMALGINGVVASVAGGLLSALALIWVTWSLGRTWPLARTRPFVLLLAPAWVALDPGLILEASQGLETVFFTLLVTGCALLTFREAAEPDRVPWSGLVGGLAALTRPEGILIYGLLQLTRVLHKRQRQPETVWVGWTVFALLVGSHLVYRWTFYGDIVPNTFHAKTGGGSDMWLRGLSYVGEFCSRHLGLVLCALVGALVAVRRASLRDVATLVVVGVVGIYVVLVGGDFKPSGRFLLPILPLIALLAQEGVAWALDEYSERAWDPRPALVVLLLLCTGNAVLYWPATAQMAAYRVVDQEERVAVGEFLRTSVPPDTWIAIHSAGTVPYISGLQTIDCWGLSDRAIAQREMPTMGQGTAGHEKTDYDYVFGRHPAVYLPEVDLVTPEPTQLLIPIDFPPSFESHYGQKSGQMPDGRWVNLWLHILESTVPSPSSPAADPTIDQGDQTSG